MDQIHRYRRAENDWSSRIIEVPKAFFQRVEQKLIVRLHRLVAGRQPRNHIRKFPGDFSFAKPFFSKRISDADTLKPRRPLWTAGRVLRGGFRFKRLSTGT